MILIKKKAAAIIFVAVLSILYFSCASSSLTIPGEKKRVLENLASEYYNIAEAYLDLKNYKKAMEYYDLAMLDESIYNQAFYKKGYAAALAKDWTVAEQIYRELLAQDSKNTNFAIAFAYIVAQKGNLQEASVMYGNLVKENPYDETLAKDNFLILVSLEDFEAATLALENFKSTFPTSKDITLLESSLEKINPKEDQELNTENSMQNQ